MTALTLHLLLWTLLVATCQSGDLMTRQELNDLYNSRVQTAELVVRPKPFATHSGVRVTLEENGRQYLIHKGRNYGVDSEANNFQASDTVVTDAAMSNRWWVEETKDFGGRVTVGQMVEVAGPIYKLWGGNCHDAAKAMMKLGD